MEIELTLYADCMFELRYVLVSSWYMQAIRTQRRQYACFETEEHEGCERTIARAGLSRSVSLA